MQVATIQNKDAHWFAPMRYIPNEYSIEKVKREVIRHIRQTVREELTIQEAIGYGIVRSEEAIGADLNEVREFTYDMDIEKVYEIVEDKVVKKYKVGKKRNYPAEFRDVMQNPQQFGIITSEQIEETLSEWCQNKEQIKYLYLVLLGYDEEQDKTFIRNAYTIDKHYGEFMEVSNINGSEVIVMPQNVLKHAYKRYLTYFLPAYVTLE